MNFDQEHTELTNTRINRVIKYASTDGYCCAIGLLPDVGVATGNQYRDISGQLRGNTSKIYLHGVDTKIGNFLDFGQDYTAVCYKVLFIPQAVGNRRWMYHFSYGGYEYVFVDYSGSMLDTVQLDSKFTGKTVELVESLNTTLLSHVYNNGLKINAVYQNNSTCYIILKIKID